MKKGELKKVLRTALVLGMSGMLAACSGGNGGASSQTTASAASESAAESKQEEAETSAEKTDEVTRTKMEISVGCGTSSGVGYATASTVGAILQNLYPEYYTCKPEVTTGGAESMRLLSAGDVVLCSAMADDVLAAYNGERDFTDLKDRIRYITCGNITTIQCFVQDELDVKTLADCAGLRIAVMSGTMYNYYWDYMLETYRMTNDDFASVESFSTKDAVEAFRNNQIDVICLVTAIPNATIQDLAMSDGVKLLTMTEEERDKIISIQPCFEKISVAGSYYSWDTDIDTVGVRNVYVCLDDTDYQVVYDWVKAIDENNDALKAAHPQSAEYGDHSRVLTCQKIPFADAAKDYYTEIGLIK